MNCGQIKRRNRVRAIENDFGELLEDVVIGLREQRCSWKTIAGVLGVSNQTLITWRRAFQFAPIDRRNVVREKRDIANKDRVAQRLGYMNFNDLYADLRFGKKMLVKDIADFVGVHENTIYKWTSEQMKEYMYIHTPARVASRTENLKKARKAKMKKYGTLWTP